MHGPLRLACLLTLCTLPHTTIEAQGLGKILKKAKDKAVDAASKATEPRKTGTAAAADSAAAPSRTAASAPAAAAVSAPESRPAPRVEGPPLEITATNLDLFIPVMKADADRRAGLLAFRKGIKAYLSCKQTAQRSPNAYVGGDKKALAEATAYREGLEKRWGALFDVEPPKRDFKAMDALDDTVRYARELEFQQVVPAVQKCGKPPFPPAGYRLDDGEKDSEERFKLPEPTPVLPEGISAKQFGLLRERIGYWLLSKGTIAEPLIAPAEAAVLKARLAELSPYADYFAQGAMPYKDWGDVWAWR